MRLKSLDALRGVAALQVVAAHLLLVGENWMSFSNWWVRWSPLRLILEARPAVIFFFVLSGFVLTIAVRSNKDTYRDFVVRRACRIYLPFAAAIVLAEMLCMLIQPGQLSGVNQNIASDWADFSAVTFARHFLMTGERNDIQLNGVVWSLIHEMRISLVLPALVAFLAWRMQIAALSIVGLSVGSLGLLAMRGQTQLYTSEDAFSAMLLSLYYLFPFGVGACAAMLHQSLTATFARYRNVGWTLIPVGCVLAYRSGISELTDYVVSLSAGLLIIGVLAIPRAEMILGTAPLQWLGRISYSLYLVHLPILLAGLHLFSGAVPLVIIVAIAFPLTLIGAHLFNIYVEASAAKLGKVLTNRPQGPDAEPLSITGR